MAYRPPQIPLATAREYAFRTLGTASDATALHGDCSRPIDRELRGVGALATARLAQWRDDDDLDYAEGHGLLGEFKQPATHTVYVRVRCRRCPECLRHKRRLWTARAIAEVRLSERTWFGTLTVAPEYRFWAKAKAERKTERFRCESWSALSPSERTKAIAGEFQPEVTKWLKRLRKNSKARLRYLLVVEPHADEFPHFHLLLHEQDRPVSKRVLEASWKFGFTSWRLVPDGEHRQVGYVCKYLTKDAQTRVRASRQYGRPDTERVTERIATHLAKAQMEKHGLSRERKVVETNQKALF